jgi:hypothetical protein
VLNIKRHLRHEYLGLHVHRVGQLDLISNKGAVHKYVEKRP